MSSIDLVIPTPAGGVHDIIHVRDLVHSIKPIIGKALLSKDELSGILNITKVFQAWTSPHNLFLVINYQYLKKSIEKKIIELIECCCKNIYKETPYKKKYIILLQTMADFVLYCNAYNITFTPDFNFYKFENKINTNPKRSLRLIYKNAQNANK